MLTKKKFNFYTLIFLILLCSFSVESKLKTNSNNKKAVVVTEPGKNMTININSQNGITLGSNNEFFDKKKHEYFYRRYITCREDNCAYPNTCIDNNTCQCGAGFADRQKQ